MNKKTGNFFERYVDKIVLVVVGILSLLVLWIFIFSGPYAVEYESGGRKFNVSDLDIHIKQQAEELEDKLNESATEKHYVRDRRKEFFDRLACSVSDIPNNIYYPLPSSGSGVAISDRIYVLPDLNELEVGDAAVESIRTVVHMPVDEVDIQHPYNSVETELADIDLVTVEGSIDISSLYDAFHQSFSGRRVKGDWRDDDLAQPVFAAVELQRQRLIGKNKWSNWQSVPRTKVDDFKEILDIPQKVQDTKYEISLLMNQLGEFDVQSGILQPETYEFASSATEWLTPMFHKEYEEIVKQEKDQAQRKELEMKKEARQRELEAKKQQKQSGRRGGGMGAMGPMGPGGGMGSRRPRSQRRGRDRRTSSRRGDDRRGIDTLDPRKASKEKEERTVDDVYTKFDALFLEEEKPLADMREPLVFWAHDDTIEPGNSYQYRIRVGVFNPIANQNWFTEDQIHLKDEVILWSAFSEVTEVVSVPKMVHFFPLNISEQDEDGQKGVNIQVSKFYHGKWRSEEFEVKPGELIGKLVEKDEEEESEKEREMTTERFSSQESEESEPVDYATSAVLVDMVQSNDWDGTGVLRPREYAEVLYTEDGTTIERLAVRNRYWSSEQQKQFNIIKDAEDEKIQVYLARGQARRRKGTRRQAVPAMPMGPMGPGFMGPMGPGFMGPMGPGFMGPQ